jgi:antirestriction protein ArdC
MADIYQQITDKLVAILENGSEGKWHCPWHNRGLSMPTNVTGRQYRGINIPILWATAEELGYPTAIWGTYRQWLERGAQVRKGERSTMVVFWKKLDKKPKPGEEIEGDDGKRGYMYARGYFVFNAAQVDNWEAPTPPAALLESQRITQADAFFQHTRSRVVHGGDRAFYRPSGDEIRMPEFEQFESAIRYYSTLAHEHVHWTGSEPRCNRQFGERFGDEAYAFEELVAELGAAFLCAQLGLDNEPREDHAAYVKSWLKVLQNDKRAIFTAAGKAQAAVDFLHNLQPQAAQAA